MKSNVLKEQMLELRIPVFSYEVKLKLFKSKVAEKYQIKLSTSFHTATASTRNEIKNDSEKLNQRFLT